MYAWMITADHLDLSEHDIPSRKGWVWLSSGMSKPADPDEWAKLTQKIISTGLKFKLYDDDDVLYYEGHWLELKDDNEPEDQFAPLDWAMNDSGCTRIDYLENGKWATL